MYIEPAALLRFTSAQRFHIVGCVVCGVWHLAARTRCAQALGQRSLRGRTGSERHRDSRAVWIYDAGEPYALILAHPARQKKVLVQCGNRRGAQVTTREHNASLIACDVSVMARRFTIADTRVNQQVETLSVE